MAKQKFCHGNHVICDGSPSRIRRVRRISLGITTLPSSSILRTIPVALNFPAPPFLFSHRFFHRCRFYAERITGIIFHRQVIPMDFILNKHPSKTPIVPPFQFSQMFTGMHSRTSCTSHGEKQKIQIRINRKTDFLPSAPNGSFRIDYNQRIIEQPKEYDALWRNLPPYFRIHR